MSDERPTATLGTHLEAAWLFLRVLGELLVAPLHLVWFLLNRSRHRAAFRRALQEDPR